MKPPCRVGWFRPSPRRATSTASTAAEWPPEPPCRVGDRVRLTAPVLDNFPPPGLPVGLAGKVTWVGQWTNVYTRQLAVEWENGRRLMLLDDDQFEVIREDR